VLTADVANNYFNLRSTDIELDVLSRSIALQRRALELVTARHDLGAVSGLDVAQQQALLDTTLTQVDVLKKQRAQYEHALATLTGTPAPSFALGRSGHTAVGVITVDEGVGLESAVTEVRGLKAIKEATIARV